MAQTELIETLTTNLGATWDKQVETNGQLEQIREDIISLREDNKRQWQLGRLRLQWLPRRKRESQGDD